MISPVLIFALWSHSIRQPTLLFFFFFFFFFFSLGVWEGGSRGDRLIHIALRIGIRFDQVTGLTLRIRKHKPEQTERGV